MNPPQPEAEFQVQVIDLAHLLGYRVAHFRRAVVGGRWMTPVAADGAGWPDLALTRMDRFLVIELKSNTGSLGKEQRTWLEALRAAGVETHVFKPRDWELIVETLRRA